MVLCCVACVICADFVFLMNLFAESNVVFELLPCGHCRCACFVPPLSASARLPAARTCATASLFGRCMTGFFSVACADLLWLHVLQFPGRSLQRSIFISRC